jgi:cytochrome c-type biogenesis protein
MTGELLAAIGTALWLGILTSISPCPLASNIAAISFVGKNVSNPTRVFIAGLLYTAGRMLTYLALGVLLVSSILSAPAVSESLQRYMNIALGPLLILVGMVLLDLISFSLPGIGGSQRLQKRVESSAW